MTLAAPWIPSPMRVIVEALEEARVSEKDVLVDLGAGDGRVVVTAAKKFGAYSIGVEIDWKLCRTIMIRAEEHGVRGLVEAVHGDLFTYPLKGATVVYVYLYKSLNERLAPRLSWELRPGARVIAIDFPIPGWIPVRVKRLDDGRGVIRTIYVYVVGASDPRHWVVEKARAWEILPVPVAATAR